MQIDSGHLLIVYRTITTIYHPSDKSNQLCFHYHIKNKWRLPFWVRHHIHSLGSLLPNLQNVWLMGIYIVVRINYNSLLQSRIYIFASHSLLTNKRDF